MLLDRKYVPYVLPALIEQLSFQTRAEMVSGDQGMVSLVDGVRGKMMYVEMEVVVM